MLNHLRLLLLPLSWLYGLVILIRNKFYDWGVFRSVRFDLPVICVGNLVAGGSGKTPTIEYIVKLLNGYKIAILSRGYGRKTTGLIIADQHSTAQTIGDEPMQYYRKFKEVTVAVCEDRVRGIEHLKADHDVILLDDAYQHRAVKAGYSIVLFEFSKLLKRQFLLPAGNLREPLSNYDRANAVLITKSPEQINMIDQITIRRKIDTTLAQRISFSSLQYGELVHLFDRSELMRTALKDQKVWMLTGIANPQPMFDELARYTSKIERIAYPDHYDFSREELNRLISDFHRCPSKEKIIITTEKDSQRLLSDNLKDLLLNLPVYYLPVEINLASKDKLTFDQNILNYVANAKRVS